MTLIELIPVFLIKYLIFRKPVFFTRSKYFCYFVFNGHTSYPILWKKPNAKEYTLSDEDILGFHFEEMVENDWYVCNADKQKYLLEIYEDQMFRQRQADV